MARLRSAAPAASLVVTLVAAVGLAGLGCERQPGSGDAGGNAAALAPADGDGPIVITRQGPVRGARDGRAEVFRGIPYAAAPVGERRFAPPGPAPSWTEPRDATRFGPRCPQPGPFGGVIGDEDCLTLNVWRPAGTGPGPKHPLRPVMVFIHGGGDVLGGGDDPLRNGRVLAAEQDLIVVTFNYRLGILGFLAHPELTAAHGGSGNWAYLDQIAALDWVAANIAGFGGDPDRVTVAGDSAGALAVCVLLTSPLAAGKLAGAILHSGGCDVASLAWRERQGVVLEHTSGCAPTADPFACVRALPATKLVELAPAVVADVSSWELAVGGAIDGQVVPRDPWQQLAAGQHDRVPVLLGNTAEETTVLVPTVVRSCEDYAAAVARSFPDRAAAALAEYPCAAYPSGRAAYIALTTDALFGCQARRIARALTADTGAGAPPPVYRYVYRYARGDPAVAELGAFHGAELQLLFGTHTRFGYAVSDAELELAAAIRAAWASFARTGSPVTPATPGWAAYEPSRDNALILDVPITTADAVSADHCDFWDQPGASPSPVGQATPVPPSPQ